jgi:hypothetical protein
MSPISSRNRVPPSACSKRPAERAVAIKTNVRIIAATNKDLRVSIQQGIFREDLFFRLNGSRARARCRASGSA